MQLQHSNSIDLYTLTVICRQSFCIQKGAVLSGQPLFILTKNLSVIRPHHRHRRRHRRYRRDPQVRLRFRVFPHA